MHPIHAKGLLILSITSSAYAQFNTATSPSSSISQMGNPMEPVSQVVDQSPIITSDVVNAVDARSPESETLPISNTPGDMAGGNKTLQDLRRGRQRACRGNSFAPLMNVSNPPRIDVWSNGSLIPYNHKVLFQLNSRFRKGKVRVKIQQNLFMDETKNGYTSPAVTLDPYTLDFHRFNWNVAQDINIKLKSITVDSILATHENIAWTAPKDPTNPSASTLLGYLQPSGLVLKFTVISTTDPCIPVNATYSQVIVPKTAPAFFIKNKTESVIALLPWFVTWYL